MENDWEPSLDDAFCTQHRAYHDRVRLTLQLASIESLVREPEDGRMRTEVLEKLDDPISSKVNLDSGV
jgi:hypothetical protein